jgi:hypothetical protein
VKLKAVAFCMLAMVATPAAAQVPGWGPYGAGPYAGDAIPPHAIYAQLRAHGLRPVTQPVQTGRYIVVRAVDPYGTMVRILLNAHWGNVVAITPLPPAPVVGEGYGRPYGPYAARPYRPYPEPYPDYGVPPRPDLKSEPAPGPRSDSQPGIPKGPEQRTAAVTPNRMPLPRPRPANPVAAAAAPTAPAAAVAAPVAATPKAPDPTASAPASAPSAAATPAPANTATAAVKPAPEVTMPPKADLAPTTTGSIGPAKDPEPLPPPAPLE